MKSANSGFVESVHLFRGIAALMVVVDHLFGWFPLPLLDPVIAVIGGHGKLGVAVFFVISGFVLPLSLGPLYRLENVPRFLLRRAVRIEPVFLVSLIFACVLFGVKTRLASNGVPWVPDFGQLAAHLFYLIPFTEHEWLNAVYWTLAVEFQYYLVIGLSFPLILAFGKKSPRFAALLTPILFSLLVFPAVSLPQVELLKYSPYFALGLLGYFLHQKQISLGAALIVGALCLVPGFVTELQTHHLLVAYASLFLMVCWRAPRLRMRWLGTISYSLYIIHYPIVDFVNQAARGKLTGDLAWLLYAVPVLNLVLSFAAAWLLYRLVEKPSQSLSRKFRRKS